MDGGEQFEMAARLAGLRDRQEVVQSGARSKGGCIHLERTSNLTAY